MNYSLFY